MNERFCPHCGSEVIYGDIDFCGDCDVIVEGETVERLERVDVSDRNIKDPGVTWLLAHGFRFKVNGDRVELVSKE